MKNPKIPAIGMLVTIGLTVVVAVIEPAIYYQETIDALYSLVGIGLFIFGIWSSILLLKK